MESNNISTKIVSILIPLILVLVVLVPITNAVSGDGEGGTRTITQDGAFMKEIKLDELDKSQEYVIADINTQTYKDRQLVFYGLSAEGEKNGIYDCTSLIATAWYGTWIDEDNNDNQPITGIMMSETDGYLYYDYANRNAEMWDSDVDGEYCIAISNQLSISWQDNDWLGEPSYWILHCGNSITSLIGGKVYVATNEATDYVGVHAKNYNNEYYIDSNSQAVIWSTFYTDVESMDIGQSIINYYQFTQNNWNSGIEASYYNTTDYEDIFGIYEGLNYVQNTPLTVSVKNSNVKIDSRWNFDILGENIDFNDYDTSFTGIIPYKVTIEGGDGGISGPAGTLIQMVPIFALLGILSALIIPIMRKEDSI